MLFFHLFSKVIKDRIGRLDAEISHNQDLFQLFIKVFINFRKPAEQAVKAGNYILPCFCQA